MNDTLNKLNINYNKIKLKKSVKIITDNNNRYVVKKNKKIKKDIYKYLENREFKFFPDVYTNTNDNVEVTRYIDEIDTPCEQKLNDMLYLTSILHTKTTFYKEIDLDEIKKIYEEQLDYLNYLYSYYSDINNSIENETYMSPSNYLLIRNITNIYSIINIGITYINKWYDEISKRKTVRFCLNHNNLELDHLLEDDSNIYLISWDKADFNYNVNDLYNFYKNNYDYIEIKTILNIYQSKYKLENYEYYYFIANLCNIDKINFKQPEIDKIKEIYIKLEYINGVVDYVLKNDSKKPSE